MARETAEDYGSSKYGYYPKASKSFLIVKREYKHAAKQIFRESKIKRATQRAKHLGVIWARHLGVIWVD